MVCVLSVPVLTTSALSEVSAHLRTSERGSVLPGQRSYLLLCVLLVAVWRQLCLSTATQRQWEPDPCQLTRNDGAEPGRLTQPGCSDALVAHPGVGVIT
jgi:hypothetical protein